MGEDQVTSIGEVIGGIIGLSVAAFIIFRIIQAVAELANAIQRRSNEPISDAREGEASDED